MGDYEVFCDGLLVHEIRQPTEEEQNAIRHRASRSLASFWLALVWIPLLFVLGGVTGTLAGNTENSPWAFACILLIVGGVVATAWLPLRIRDRIRERRMLAKSHPNDRVLTFVRTAEPEDVGFMVNEPLVLESFCVLEAASLRIRQNTKLLKVFQPCGLTYVAAPPPIIGVNEQRVLTPEEHDEITKHITRMRRPHLVFWVMTVWASIAVLSLATNSPENSAQRFMAWAVITIAIVSIIEFVKQRHLRRLLIDCNVTGIAMGAYHLKTGRLCEVLMPHQVVWSTEDGPVEWRKHKLDE